jgi:hypothetical protein
MKYSSEKRTSEFNKTRKGGNNEFPNWNYLDCVLKVVVVTFFMGHRIVLLLNLSVNSVCSVTRERHIVFITLISKDCRESETYYRKSWEMLCMNLTGLLLKKTSWPWRKLYFSEVQALHSVEDTRSIPDCALHVTFWCYLGSLGENNHYYTFEQLTTALRTGILCHQRYSSLVFRRVWTVSKSASCFVVSTRLSVRPSTCINTTPTGWISVKFCMGTSMKICRENQID